MEQFYIFLRKFVINCDDSSNQIQNLSRTASLTRTTARTAGKTVVYRRNMPAAHTFSSIDHVTSLRRIYIPYIPLRKTFILSKDISVIRNLAWHHEEKHKPVHLNISKIT